MNEIWKDVYGWEEYYQVSNFGGVRSKTRFVVTCDKNKVKYTKRRIPGKILSGSIDATGYYRVDMRNKTAGIRKNSLIHRLVAIAFIDNVAEKPHINHKDGVKTNNNVKNLEWCTHAENMHHAFKNGFMKPFIGTEKGEKCPSSKLTNAQAMEIKKRLKGDERLEDIAFDYPVGISAISEIKSGRSWKHIIA